MPTSKRILLVPEWSNDLSNTYEFTLVELSDAEIAERASLKSAQDSFTRAHLAPESEYRRLFHDQSGLCYSCSAPLDASEITHVLDMDGKGVFCQDCSPIALMARATQAVKDGQGIRPVERVRL